MNTLKFEDGQSVEDQMDNVKRASMSSAPLKRFLQQSSGVLKATEQLETIKSVARSRSKIKQVDGLVSNNTTSVDTKDQFIKMSTVQKSIQDNLNPITVKNMEIAKTQKGTAATLRDHQMQIKNHQKKLDDIEHTLKDMVELRGLINTNKANILKNQKTCTAFIDETRAKVDYADKQIIQCQRAQHQYEQQINGREDRQKQANQYYNTRLEALQDRQYDYSELQDKKSSKNQYNIEQINLQIENQKFRYQEYQKKVIAEVKVLTTKMEEEHKKELLKVDLINRKITSFKNVENKLNDQSQQIRQLMGYLHSNDDLAAYLERSLPLQMHMTICEMMRQITGGEYHKNLVEYENVGMEKLHNFRFNSRGHAANVRLLHERVQQFAEHFRSKCQFGKFNDPLPAFEFGRDYAPNMPFEARAGVCQKAIDDALNLRQRYDNEWKQLQALKDYYPKLALCEDDEEVQVYYKGLANMKDYQIPLFQSYVMSHKFEKNQSFDSMLFNFVGQDEFLNELEGINEQIDILEADIENLSSAVENQSQSNTPNNRMQMMQMKGGIPSGEINSPTAQAQAPATKRDTTVGGRLSKLTCNIGNQQRKRGIKAERKPKTPAANRNKKETFQEFFIVNQALDRKALRQARSTYENKNKHLVKEFNKMVRKVKLLDLMIPDDIKELKRQERAGKEIDFDQMAKEQEIYEENRTLDMIQTRAMQEDIGKQVVPVLPLAGPEAPEPEEQFDKEAKVGRVEALKSGRKKIKKAFFKIRMSLSLAQHRQIKLKSLVDARPDVKKHVKDGHVCCFSEAQINKISEMIDHNIDWVRVYLKTQVEGKIEDQDQHLQGQFAELKDFVLSNMSKVNTQCNAAISKVENVYTQCQTVQQDMSQIMTQYKEDSANMIKFRQRIFTDIKLTNDVMIGKQEAAEQLIKKFSGQCNRNQKIIGMLLESSMIDSLLMSQDLNDKEKLKMLAIEKPQYLVGSNKDRMQPGFKSKLSVINDQEDGEDKPPAQDTGDADELPFNIDKEAVLQEGSFRTNDMKLKQMQLACLNYTAAPVHYRDVKIAQSELIAVKDKLLIECQNLVVDLHRFHSCQFETMKDDNQHKAQKQGILKQADRNERGKVQKQNRIRIGEPEPQPIKKQKSVSPQKMNEEQKADKKEDRTIAKLLDTKSVHRVQIETLKYQDPQNNTKNNFDIPSLIKCGIDSKMLTLDEKRSQSQISKIFKMADPGKACADDKSGRDTNYVSKNRQNIMQKNDKLNRESSQYKMHCKMTKQYLNDQILENERFMVEQTCIQRRDKQKRMQMQATGQSDQNTKSSADDFSIGHMLTNNYLDMNSSRPKTGVASGKFNKAGLRQRANLSQIDMGSENLLSRGTSNQFHKVEIPTASTNILNGNDITVNVVNQFTKANLDFDSQQSRTGNFNADIQNVGYDGTGAFSQSLTAAKSAAEYQTQQGHYPEPSPQFMQSLQYMAPGGGTSGGAAQYFPMRINIINQARSRTPGCGQQRNLGGQQTAHENLMPLIEPEEERRQQVKSNAVLDSTKNIQAFKNQIKSRGNIKNFAKFNQLHQPGQTGTDSKSNDESKPKLGLRKSSLSSYNPNNNKNNNGADYRTIKTKNNDDLVVHSSSIYNSTARTRSRQHQPPPIKSTPTTHNQYSVKKKWDKQRKASLEMDLIESQKIRHESLNNDFLFSPKSTTMWEDKSTQRRPSLYPEHNYGSVKDISTRQVQRPDGISINVYQNGDLGSQHQSIAQSSPDYQPMTATLPAQGSTGNSQLPRGTSKIHVVGINASMGMPNDGDMRDSLVSRRLQPNYQTMANSTLDHRGEEQSEAEEVRVALGSEFGPIPASDTARVKKEMEEMSFIGHMINDGNKAVMEPPEGQ